MSDQKSGKQTGLVHHRRQLADAPSSKRIRTKFVADVLNEAKRRQALPMHTRRHSEWIELFIARNVADQEPETWLGSGAQFANAFQSKANALRWTLLSLRREGGATRQALESPPLAKAIGSRLAVLSDREYRDLLETMETLRAPSDRIADIRARMKTPSRRRVTAATFNDFLSSKARPLAEDVVYVLVHYLAEIKLLSTASGREPIPFAPQLSKLHAALNDFLDVAAESKRDFVNAAIGYAEDATGYFLLYRPSQHAPGHFVRALLTVSKHQSASEDGSPTLVVEETYLYDYQPIGAFSFLEKYRGVMSKKAGCPFMLTCRQTKRDVGDTASRDDSRGAPRYSLFPQTVYSNTHGVVSMTGITVSPFAGGHAFALPVCLERTLVPVNDKFASLSPVEARKYLLLTNALQLGVFAPERTDCIPVQIQSRLRQMQASESTGYWGTGPR